jgi:phospholipid N-methyltransferase
MDIGGCSLEIRQFSWHQANANQVWPGTLNLADYMVQHIDKFRDTNVLELGAATGALSIFLQMAPQNLSIVTSDIDDGKKFVNEIYIEMLLLQDSWARLNTTPLHIPVLQ